MTYSQDNDAHTPGRLILLRHGQTAWSQSGQHTGRTNIPLTQVGRQQAQSAGDRLHAAFPQGFEPEHVFVSPLLRAQQTAQLAGFEQFSVLEGIAEWDYGRAEGRTRQTIGQMAGLGTWDIWEHGTESLPEAMNADWLETLPDGTQVPVHAARGETLAEVAVRARGAVDQVMPILLEGHNVLLVAHAHILRILATQWLSVDPHVAKLLRLDTAHYCVLSFYKGDRVIEQWNL